MPSMATEHLLLPGDNPCCPCHTLDAHSQGAPTKAAQGCCNGGRRSTTTSHLLGLYDDVGMWLGQDMATVVQGGLRFQLVRQSIICLVHPAVRGAVSLFTWPLFPHSTPLFPAQWAHASHRIASPSQPSPSQLHASVDWVFVCAEPGPVAAGSERSQVQGTNLVTSHAPHSACS
jgi:hypothetical protein